MTRYILLSFLFFANLTIAQRQLKDFHLRRTLKQDGFQYQFNVLDRDRRGANSYNKEKFYYWYKAQGIRSTQGQSSGLLLNGLFEGFYENDQLSEKGDFKKGLKRGEWMYWRSDGSLIASERWSNGEINVRKTYDEEGQLIKTIRSKGKVLKGDAGDTTIVKRKFFKTETRYYRNREGQLQRVESWKKDELGQVKFYEDGKLDHVVKYKDGEEVIKEEKPVKEDDKKPKKDKDKTKKEKKPREKKPREKKEKEKED